MENDINELSTLQQEIEVLENEERECIKLIKKSESKIEVSRLWEILSDLWNRIDNAQKYKYQIEERINLTIYQQ